MGNHYYGSASGAVHGKQLGLLNGEIESDTWNTPAHIIALVRKLMGDIDLDPATNSAAQKLIKAHRFFTRHDNGLAQPWEGRTWLRPPYSQPLLKQFIAKLINEYRAGRVTEAVVLTNNASETEWFKRGWPFCLGSSKGSKITHSSSRKSLAYPMPCLLIHQQWGY
jgi:DNA N-6-adenine-methyltransferase (Dam)